jgi:alkanesulfonate monooxygenase SsuD/methylene tetrahydromethanopterin reductase-like flavin-dependent oxidoreductase (luciferase family)
MDTFVDNGLTAELSAKIPGLGWSAVNYAGVVRAYDGFRAAAARVPVALMDEMPVLWVFVCDAREVRRGRCPLWSGLDEACVGLGRYRGLSVAVYDRSQAVQAVDGSIVDTPEDVDDKVVRVVAHRIIDDEVLNTDIGPQTPFFII